MKKFVAIIVCLTFLWASIPVSAIDEGIQAGDVIVDNVYTINEYEYISKLQSISDSQLRSIGATEDMIFEIRNIDFLQLVKERATLSDDQLRSYGYTSEEINQLRFVAAQKSPSGIMMRSISSSDLQTSVKCVETGTVNVGGDDLKYGDFIIVFIWDHVPYMRFFDDQLVVAFKGTTSAYTYNTSCGKFRVNANELIGDEVHSFREYDWSVSDYQTGQAICVSFAMEQLEAISPSETRAYPVQSGMGRIRLTTDWQDSRLYMDVAYGHTVLNLKPSFSVDFSTTGSIIAGALAGAVDFGLGIDSQHNCGIFSSNFSTVKGSYYTGNIFGIDDD